MQELIRTALLNADQAEVYTSEDSSDSIGFSDGKLDAVDTSLSSALALRIIKDGKIGFAHTRNLLEPKHLVKQALLSAENGMEARFDFPHTTSVPSFDTYDPAIEIVSKDELIQRGRELLDYVKSQTDAQMNLNFGYSTSKSSLANSTGTQLSRSESSFGMFTQLIFPGTGSGLMKFKRSQSPVWLGRQDLDEIIQLYEISRQQIVPATGKMPVIFHAQALYSLIWRLDEAINAANIFNKVSPLCGRTGEQLLHPKLSYYQDPFDAEMSFCGGFDEEGVPTQRYSFFEDGVFKAIPTDLNYAQKLNLPPSGNGFRSSIEAMPVPRVINGCIALGDKSLEQMIASIDNGIIVYSLMGAHSGNILNGDFSVGVASGFLIKNGKLIGRVKDCMLSGNVYENLLHIEAIENEVTTMGGRKFPSLLLDQVSIAGQ